MSAADSIEAQEAAERKARRATHEGVGRPYRAAVPPENVCVIVGRRPSIRGGHIFVADGTEGLVREASVDEERFIREAYPQVDGWAENFDLAARQRELEATREGVETALELLKRRRRAAAGGAIGRS